MHVDMFTNVYRPRVGGITRSIDAFAERLRAKGHRVRIVAPHYDESSDDPTDDVLRAPAIDNVLERHALPLPSPGLLSELMNDEPPDVVHAHHPFLLGATAHRFAAACGAPIVYTHHTRFDAYAAYFPTEHGLLQDFVTRLSVRFADLCDAVVAPGTYVARALRDAGVEAPIHVIPTGVDVARFASGDGVAFRRRIGVPNDAPLIGHVGRLADEKNLDFLGRAIARTLVRRPGVHCLIVREGRAAADLDAIFAEAGVADRVHAPGVLQDQNLVDAYAAMNVFAFASRSETQGMVLGEAMAAGVPVVALDASGVEDILVDGEQGRLLVDNNNGDDDGEDEAAFAAALEEILFADGAARQAMRSRCLATARDHSIDRCVERLSALYGDVIDAKRVAVPSEARDEPWDAFLRRMRDEWALLGAATQAARDAIVEWSTD